MKRIVSLRLLLLLSPFLLAALLSMATASSLTLLYGESPRVFYRLLFTGTWGSAYGIGQVLFKATPLLCTGMAVALALRAGLFNIGCEGQIILGAFATALCGTALPPGTPALVAIPLCLLCGFAAGALLGAFAGFLKWTTASHEVIVTILLNFVVRAVMVGLGARYFLKESLHTAPIIATSELPRLSAFLPFFRGSAANSALFVSLFLLVLCALLLRYTSLGLALRTLGENQEAARAFGMHPGKLWTLALFLSGGLAGLGGANFVLGYKHYYEDGFSGGVGYMGIAVAVLGQHRPLSILFAALLFGTLSQGGLAVNGRVPRELIDVLTAVVIFAVAAATPEARKLLAALPRKIPESEEGA